MYGRNFVPVPYTEDLEMPVSRILEYLTEETELLILLNPNNPMGNVYTEEEFQEILKACKEKEITVLIDEAYHYFYPNTFMHYALTERRVFVTRTFSKLFSLAGCRLGYVAGHPEEILENPKILSDLISHFEEGRAYLLQALEEHHYPYKGEAGNFLFIKPRRGAEEIVKKMKEDYGILIKSYPAIGKLGTCLRVTIGEKKYMERFMKALLELDSKTL